MFLKLYTSRWSGRYSIAYTVYTYMYWQLNSRALFQYNMLTAMSKNDRVRHPGH